MYQESPQMLSSINTYQCMKMSLKTVVKHDNVTQKADWCSQQNYDNSGVRSHSIIKLTIPNFNDFLLFFLFKFFTLVVVKGLRLPTKRIIINGRSWTISSWNCAEPEWFAAENRKVSCWRSVYCLTGSCPEWGIHPILSFHIRWLCPRLSGKNIYQWAHCPQAFSMSIFWTVPHSIRNRMSCNKLIP